MGGERACLRRAPPGRRRGRSGALALLALERVRPKLAAAWAWVLVFPAVALRALVELGLPWLALVYGVLAAAGVPFVLRFGRRKRLAMLALEALRASRGG